MVACPRFAAVGLLPHLPNPSAREHRHACHELVLVLAGRYVAEVGSRRYEARVGDSLYYPAGLGHRPRSDAGPRAQIQLLQWHGEPPGPQPRRTSDPGGHLRLALDWLWQMALGDPPAPQAVLDGLLLALLHHRRRSEAGAAPGADLFQRARNYLAGDLAYPVSLTELAEAMDCSPATLHRTFVARTGLAPMRYRQRLRVERAIALLRAGDRRDLASLGRELGFADASHLSRAVRRQTGRPPGAWRANATAASSRSGDRTRAGHSA